MRMYIDSSLSSDYIEFRDKPVTSHCLSDNSKIVKKLKFKPECDNL
jgi:hypothetical protein